jgi:hypothetical protein
VPIPYHLVYINRQGDKHPTTTDTYMHLARTQDSKREGHAERDIVPHLQRVIQQGTAPRPYETAPRAREAYLHPSECQLAHQVQTRKIKLKIK